MKKICFVFFICLGLSGISFAQKTIWVSHIFGENASVQGLGLFQKDDDHFQLVLKSDQAFFFGRKSIPVPDSSQIQVLKFHQNGESMEQDTGEGYFRTKIPALQGNQWLLKSSVRNGNYFLAYGLSTPLRIPMELSWSLAYLDGMGHRLWEFHLQESIKINHLEMLRDGKCLLVGSEKRKGGNKKILISLWNEYGQEVWRKTFGGKGDNEALSACQDLEGNFFVGGYFSADSSFLGNVKDLSGNEKDGFIACYTALGKERFFSRQRGDGFNAVTGLKSTVLGKVLFVSLVQGKDWRLNPFGLPRKGKQDLILGLLDPQQENEKESPLKIFPNPARELVYFGLEKPIGKGKAVATLHQKDGSVLQSKELNPLPGSSFRFNVSNTKPGAYFISLKCGSKVVTERVLVQ